MQNAKNDKKTKPLAKFLTKIKPIRILASKPVQKSRTFFSQFLPFNGIEIDSDGIKIDTNGINSDSPDLK